MFGDTNQRSRHERTLHRLRHCVLATAHVLRWGSFGGVHLCARAARRAQRSSQSTHEGQPRRIARLARTAAVVRNCTRCALAASREQRSRERRKPPLARRTCQSVVRPRIKIRALGTASSPRANQRKYLRCTSPQQRVSWLSAGGAFTCSLGDSKAKSRPTRPQHPTACRSLARRLRRLVSARRVASRCRNRKARGRVSGRTLGRLASECPER